MIKKWFRKHVLFNIRYRLVPISDYRVKVLKKSTDHDYGNAYVTTFGSTAILQNFNVERKQEYTGWHMIRYITKNLKKNGFKELIVYPAPKGNWNNLPIEERCRTLYTIYEKLGFILENKKADRTTSGHKMILRF